MLLGGSGKDTIDGGRGNDTIYGGSHKDSIKGYKGDDVIHGGTGKDTIEGGAGKDKFVFDTALSASNVDTIKDFEHNVDKIVLDADIFAAIGSSLSSGEFRKNDTGHAQDSTDKLIYETDTGKLYYDADGNGSGARVIVARFDPHTTTLSYHDFEIV
jgi:Ca2+-binding RTX toxin-like protein